MKGIQTPARQMQPTAVLQNWHRGVVAGATLVVIVFLLIQSGCSDKDPVAPTETKTVALATPQPIDTAPPQPGVIVTLQVGSMTTRETDGMTIVYVPGGTFLMGSEGENNRERPVHSVTLDSFWIDRTEVSNSQYALCVASGKCRASSYANNEAYNGDEHPVIGVSWQDAADYCAWAGARLPTEAEWEYAARGPQGNVYPWGDEFDCSCGNFDDETQIDSYVVPGGEGCDGYERTSPVTGFESGESWCGALNMAGNVWEWVSDWWSAYPSTAQTNPTGPDAGDYKMLRGGSWVYYLDFLRSAHRRISTPLLRDFNNGIRCVSEPGW